MKLSYYIERDRPKKHTNSANTAQPLYLVCVLRVDEILSEVLRFTQEKHGFVLTIITTCTMRTTEERLSRCICSDLINDPAASCIYREKSFNDRKKIDCF